MLFPLTTLVGGLLFPLLAGLFTALSPTGTDPGALSPTSPVVVGGAALLAPGAVAVALAGRPELGRRGTAAAAALVVAVALPPVASLLALVGLALPPAVVGVPAGACLLAGSVGAGVAVVRARPFAHARAVGGLLAVAGVALVGLPAAVAALGRAMGPATALAATLPFGLAWALVGYDLLARREVSVQPTRVATGGGD